ncbi:MAG: DUF3467 domain-containing protein [Candidatus Aenigmarchaeota archaeon]|nr:DUF3467 domain-containing protein [Candidatus Aenigmarchaeota archaeon]
MAEAEKKKVNLNIDPGKEAFYSNNVAIFNNPNEFVLDFAQVSPRMDMVDGKQMLTYIAKHNSVVLEPKQTKILLNLLKENVEKFEKRFGKIEVSKKQNDSKKPASKKFMDYIG